MARIKTQYPQFKVVIELPYNANAINLNNRIKEELSPLIKFRYNHMFSGFNDENLLIERIHEVADMIM